MHSCNSTHALKQWSTSQLLIQFSQGYRGSSRYSSIIASPPDKDELGHGNGSRKAQHQVKCNLEGMPHLMCFNGGDVDALIPVSTERQHFEEVLQMGVLSVRGPSYACM